MKFFSMDSPIMQALSRMGDIMWINILCVVSSIPIITIGASRTAMHYMVLKIARGEDVYLTKGFFKSFRRNFKQATIMWFIEAFLLLFLGYDFYLVFLSGANFHVVIKVVLLSAILLVLFTFTFAYPILAKFDNTVFNTIKNGLGVSIAQLPKTVLKLVMNAIPVILLIISPTGGPIVLLFGVALPAFAFAKLYNKYFQKLEGTVPEEEREEEEIEDDDRVFHDELDAALQDKDFGGDGK